MNLLAISADIKERKSEVNKDQHFAIESLMFSIFYLEYQEKVLIIFYQSSNPV